MSRKAPVCLILSLTLALAMGCSQPSPYTRQVNKAAELAVTGQERLGQGETRRARRAFDQALKISQGIDDPRGVAQQLNNLGAAALEQGDLEKARDLFNQAGEINQQWGFWDGASTNQANLATLAQKEGRLPAARDHLQAALDYAVQAASSEARGRVLMQMAGLALDQQDDAEARHLLSTAQPLARKPALQGPWRYQMGRLLQAQGDLSGAMEHFRAALAADRQVLDRTAMAADLVALAEVSQLQGDLDAAFGYWARAFGIYDALGKKDQLRSTLEHLRQLNTQGNLGRDLAPFMARLAPIATK